MLRRILLTTFSRENSHNFFYHSNAVISRPSRIKPLLLGAASFALTTAVSFVHLDSNTLHNKETTVVDPATSIEFPTTLQIPSKGALPEFTLIGVGVRVVSFLKIKVYSVAFYADLSNPNLKIPPSTSPEEKFLRAIHRTLTSGMHLCEFYKRGNVSLTKTETYPRTSNSRSKPYFPAQDSVPQYPKKPRTLIIRDLGAIQNEWVAREFVLSYFDGQGNSPALKQSVFDRVAQL
ncbi:hypothetical protein B0F90DRAFT_1813544 [Multifurca ochricompacta]|uniref:Chalcone isomerase domain-containing protein n=1 Tax=Multifurca ochricompacta TaxID=376703 RepID=A0AAD4MHD9_9AGAM|nr:hypothetical protein B0F90DRAFT_1813544 [Multifurca ochricompacta]